SSNDDSNDSEYDRSESTNDSSPNTNTIKLMRYTIYNSLFDYWNEPLMVSLLASLLDPQLKMLFSWNEEAQEKAKTELTRQFKNITDSNYEQTTTSIYTTSSGDSNICCNRLHSSIFGTSTSTYTAFNPLAELKCYLDPTQTPIADDNVNPFE
ncbi:6607_t:CDS:1, partial [Racocetra fulgida]